MQTAVTSAATTVTGDLRKLHARSWSQAFLRNTPRNTPRFALQFTRAKRDSGRSSALCTVVTLLFIAQGRSWWCKGT